MTHRKGEVTARMNWRDFPRIVELALPFRRLRPYARRDLRVPSRSRHSKPGRSPSAAQRAGIRSLVLRERDRRRRLRAAVWRYPISTMIYFRTIATPRAFPGVLCPGPGSHFGKRRASFTNRGRRCGVLATATNAANGTIKTPLFIFVFCLCAFPFRRTDVRRR